ncbi:DUF5701 family protein [Corynebacterium suedekumii]|uniref:DUF5701 family protein n=1 Tax=Corynebacterium suedekumii TaxID=3049801 RepID=A0ABY8VHH0_9CORY|nr:DUF5701 family protein [Corynebacterium suedekumii]WIM69101.1 DUF5701 family protein [Corynebacterium suedekumii]
MRPTRSIADQLAELDRLGVFTLAGEREAQVRAAAAGLPDTAAHALAGLHPGWFAASALAPLLTRGEKSGFVVADMVDVDQFLPVGVELVDAPLYLVHGACRGDDLRNVSPEEALAQWEGGSRRPLTLHEGLSWALTHPEVIEPNACFMTVASRKVKKLSAAGDPTFDSRTPALWISSGTGRDGAEHRGAPKLGWCWWRNRHTWLGIASAERHTPSPPE